MFRQLALDRGKTIGNLEAELVALKAASPARARLIEEVEQLKKRADSWMTQQDAEELITDLLALLVQITGERRQEDQQTDQSRVDREC